MYHNIRYSLKIGNMGHSTFILHPSLHGKLHTVPVGILFFKAAEKILKLLEANFKGAENKKR